MNRRSAASLVASLVFAGCGGGGGGGSEDAAAPTNSGGAATPVGSFAGSSNIAMWGDSLTPPVARAMTLIFPGRAIFDGGVIGETSVQIAARELADEAHRDWVTTIWGGHNNKNAPAQIAADIAACVAHLAPGNARFIVISLLNNAFDVKGTANYQTIVELNNRLAATYPQNYLDMRGYLVSQFNPANPDEVLDFQNDEPPRSMRADEAHFNGFGADVAAARIKQFIDARGW